MNHFERVALFTQIENIETQLRGLKTLLAASSSEPGGNKHKVTPTIENDDMELSEQDEAELEKALKSAQEKEVARMRIAAEAHFQTEWDKTAKTLSGLEAGLDG